MTFRAKIFLWIAGGAVLIAAVAGLLWWILKARKAPHAPPSGGAIPAVAPAGQPLPVPHLPEGAPKAVNVQEEKQNTSIAVVVRQFVERFGSFSTASGLVNFDEVKPLATASFAEWLDGYKKQVLATEAQGFKGVTTRFISMKELSGDATHQSLEAATQRQETDGVTNTYYQRIILKLVSESGAWKVDGAFWQAKE